MVQVPTFNRQRLFYMSLAWILIGAILAVVPGETAHAENGIIEVNPLEKKPYTFKEPSENGIVGVDPLEKKPYRFKEPVPQKRECVWREGNVGGSCPVGPSTPIGDSCECVRTVEHNVTRHRGKVVAQQ